MNTDPIIQLANTGLVVIELWNTPGRFVVARPESVTGSPFEFAAMTIGAHNAIIRINAPLAMVSRESEHWTVTIDYTERTGVKRVWFSESFDSSEEAAKAIEDCYFRNRVPPAGEISFQS